MAQLKDLTVNGEARIVGNLYDNNPRVGFGTCSSAADAAIKVVVIDDSAWTLKKGNIIGVQFTNTNTAALVKLNVNDSGAKEIAYNTDRPFINTDSLVCGYAGRTIYYQYDGTYWNWISGGYSSGGGGGEYLPLSGGTMTGQIKGTLGGSWLESRDRALIRHNSGSAAAGNAFYPIFCQKTKNGAWAAGQLAGEDSLKFVYTSDTNYSGGTNQATQGPAFNSDGSSTFTGLVNINKGSLTDLIINRTDGANAATIQFKNTNGVLGAIGMTGTANGGLTRWTADYGTGYTILDRSVVKAAVSAKAHTDYNNNQTYIPTMNFLSYWNGAYNSSNNSNLTYAHQGIIQCKPAQLFSGTYTFGNTIGTISSDYSYIDLYFYFNLTSVPNRAVIRVPVTSGKYCIGQFIPGSGTQFIEVEIVMDNYSLKLDYCGYSTTMTGAQTNKTNDSGFYCYKVLGYK